MAVSAWSERVVIVKRHQDRDGRRDGWGSVLVPYRLVTAAHGLTDPER